MNTTEEALTFSPSDGFVRCGVGIVARMYTADDFPCLATRDEERQCNRDSKKFGRLFAAAPDLLAALKGLIYVCPHENLSLRDPRREIVSKSLEHAREVIAKIEGM